ncbi:MAG: transporter, inner rane subunit [Acidobacteria bacterium]|nr:transporter, inner rane subunit [Acidobacteriota bacterium]
MLDYFVRSVALRNVRHNLGHTLLTVGVVATSVTLIIFLVALIGGLQRRLVSSVTGAIPHVIIRQPERQPTAVWEVPSLQKSGEASFGRKVEIEQKKRKIEDWPVWIIRIREFDHNIIAVSPVVEGQGIISRGAYKKSVLITGVIPEEHNRVVDIQSKLVQGRFFGLNAGEIALGYQLAENFAVQLGDKIRLVSAENNEAAYTVAGIFDTGFSAVDTGSVFLSLRDAQSLFGLGTAVTSIGVKLNEIFDADSIAARLSLQVPYETRSWMQDNQTLLSGLRAQSQSSNLIIVFTVVASGFGIASILVMSVVSKVREIGILRSMGGTRRQIMGVFALEGTLVAVLGGLIGEVLGTGLCLWLGSLKTTASATGRQVEIFAMDLNLQTLVLAFALALATGFLASLYPAWRAARVNPIEVIRAT